MANLKGICIFTDGSKMDCGGGAANYSGELDVALLPRLEKDTGIFQVEVLCILKACKILGNIVRYKSKATFCSAKSKIVRECKMVLCSVSLLSRFPDIGL